MIKKEIKSKKIVDKKIKEKSGTRGIKTKNLVAEDIPVYEITQLPKITSKLLSINYNKTCECTGNNINCLQAKDWMKNQLGVWEFYYEKRDVRDKTVHPATFPISMARRVIELFTHQGELVLDPFVGSGTTLVAAQDCNRNAVGFDLLKKYVDLCKSRLSNEQLFNNSKQLAIVDDARNINQYLKPQSVKLLWTSPPYANLLNRERKNKSRRDRDNGQLGKVEQYSQDPRDLGTLELEIYSKQWEISMNHYCLF